MTSTAANGTARTSLRSLSRAPPPQRVRLLRGARCAASPRTTRCMACSARGAEADGEDRLALSLGLAQGRRMARPKGGGWRAGPREKQGRRRMASWPKGEGWRAGPREEDGELAQGRSTRAGTIGRTPSGGPPLVTRRMRGVLPEDGPTQTDRQRSSVRTGYPVRGSDNMQHAQRREQPAGRQP